MMCPLTHNEQDKSGIWFLEFDRLISLLYTRRIWGPRYSNYESRCHVCKAWKLHDEFFLKNYYESYKMSEKLQPEDWLKQEQFYGYTILDPDGWDRSNFEVDWARYLTVDEMRARTNRSTVLITE